MSELEQVKIIEQTVHYTLRELGILSQLISRPEMIRIVGSIAKIERAISDGELIPIRNKGKNSKIMVNRDQFNRWFARLNASPTIINQ